jgi:hypothetical protein
VGVRGEQNQRYAATMRGDAHGDFALTVPALLSGVRSPHPTFSEPVLTASFLRRARRGGTRKVDDPLALMDAGILARREMA